jgi:hypothetical protein
MTVNYGNPSLVDQLVREASLLVRDLVAPVGRFLQARSLARFQLARV